MQIGPWHAWWRRFDEGTLKPLFGGLARTVRGAGQGMPLLAADGLRNSGGSDGGEVGFGEGGSDGDGDGGKRRGGDTRGALLEVELGCGWV